MFRRKKTHENSGGTPPAASIDHLAGPAWAETRPFNFMHAGPEGLDEKARSRVGLHYEDADHEGRPCEVREIVTSFTQDPDDGARRNLRDLDDTVRGMAPALAAQLPEGAHLSGLCMVEYPAKFEADGITLHQGFALETTGIAKKRFYTFAEERDQAGAVRMRVVKEVDIPETAAAWSTNPLVPPGSRVTASVRGEVPLTDETVRPEETGKPSYERYLTDTMRRAIDAYSPDRSRTGMSVKEKDVLHAIPLRVPADQNRPFSVRPEHQGMPERPSRVSFGEPVELPSGTYNAYTSIASHTVAHDARAAYTGMDETFAKMKGELERERPRLNGMKAQCLIEYPRDNPDGPIDGVVVTQSRDKMIGYVIQETKGGIEVRERVVIHDEKARGKKKRRQEQQSAKGLNVPSGSRITYEVRGRQPADGAPLADKKPPFEVGLMTRMRYAIEDFNEAYPGEDDIRLK